MSLDRWLIYLGTVLIASASPGPVMLLAMANGVRQGVGKTAIGIAGSAVGMFSLMLVSTLGIGAILHSSIWLFTAVKWLGASYLIYLGLRSWLIRAPSKIEGVRTCESVETEFARKAIFLRFFFVAVSNPKGLIFFGALFPLFITPLDSQWEQFSILAVTFLVIDICWQLIYAAAGKSVVRWLQNPQKMRLFDRIVGSTLIGAGLVMAIAHLG